MNSSASASKLNPQDDDDSLDMERANLLTESHGGSNGTGRSEIPDIPMCGFLSLKFYQPYFDVDTEEVIARATQSVLYCRRETNFMALIADRPDAYGPIWIATSLVFATSIAAHLHGFFSSWLKGKTWEYNFQSILTASSLIYGFLFFASAISWFIVKQFEPKIKFSNVFCLYGYSNLIFIPAVSVCLVPSDFGAWAALFVAGLISTIFILRNLGPFIMASAPKQANVVVGIIGFMELVYVICMKLYFFYEKE